MFDLINTYFPTPDEITTEQLQSMRSRLETFGHLRFPTLDMRPDAVFGNFILDPLVFFLCGVEEAMRRQRSDVDTEQVAAGVVYDCDFVEQFLKNWAVQDRTIKQASGTLRLLFSADAAVDIDRGTRFSFDSASSSVFMLRLAHEGLLQVLPVGSAIEAGQNQTALQQVSDTQFAVDVPVLGQMGDTVARGVEAKLDRTIDGLVSCSALHDFVPGAPALTLPQMAQQARQASYAIGVGSRGQATQLIRQNFPETLGVSAVMSDDPESMRGGVNALGIRRGAMDLHVKSGTYQFQDVAYIKVPWVIEQDGDPVRKFIAPLALQHTPVRITSVTCPDSPGVNLSYEILGQSSDPVRASLLTAGFSELENLWLAVDMPQSEGTDLITLVVDDTGSYAVFKVEYWTDPLIAAASTFVDGDEVVAENCDLIVRGFLPLVLDRFDIRYIRGAGVLMALTGARADLGKYLNSVTYPDAFSLAEVAEIMRYSGAKLVQDVVVRAHLEFTVATRYLRDDAPDPMEDYTTAVNGSNSFIPYKITVQDVRALSPEYQDAEAGTDAEQLCSVGARNVGLWIDPDTITFTELGARA